MAMGRTVGRSPVRVPAIGFGTSGLGGMPDTYGYDVAAEQARETVRAIFDSPVNCLDTSRNYGFCRSEERVGEVIREQAGPEMLERIETIRQTAVRFRREAEGRPQLEAQLNALDPEQTPALSAALSPVYRWVCFRLKDATLLRDPAAAREAERAFEPLADAFCAAATALQ